MNNIDWDDIRSCDICEIQHDVAELLELDNERVCEACRIKLINRHLSDSMAMWEALSQDAYPDVKGPKNCAYRNSPEARREQADADAKRDAMILMLIKENRAQELGKLLIEQANSYAKLTHDMGSWK